MRPSSTQALARACGKSILLGEHAVVYGRPAIAIPITARQARANIEPVAPGTGAVLHAADLGRQYLVDAAPADEPLAFTVRHTLQFLGIHEEPDIRITVESDLPIAGGLGSGAAVATAIVKAIAAHFGRKLSPSEVASLVYKTEVIHHGTPSGIDNTVIAFEYPIWYRKGHAPTRITLGGSFHFVIADTGVASPTRQTVGDVRAAREADPAALDEIFDEIEAVAEAGRKALEQGKAAVLGDLMNRNQELLRDLNVSADANERLISAATAAGAAGAKLSGGGRGGNIIALASDAHAASHLEARLVTAGAASVFTTVLEPAADADVY